MSHSQPSPTCTHHEGAPAIAICTECDGDVCAACHGSDLRGYCVCDACREELAPPTTPWEDARVDYSPNAFGRTLFDIATSPRTFFGKVRFSGSWVPAVVFGVICMCLGFLFNTTWQVLFVEQFREVMATYSKDYDVPLQSLKVGMFLAIPIRVAIALALHIGLFHIATKIAGGHTSLGLTTRIIGYASAAYVFMIIPPIGEFPLGQFLAIIWLFNIEMGALRMYYRMGLWRAMFVVTATLLLLIPFGFS